EVSVRVSADTLSGRCPYPTTDDRRPTTPRIAAATRRMSSAVRRKSLLRRALDLVAVVAITLVMTLVLLEIGLRLFAPQFSPEMRAEFTRGIFVRDPLTGFRNLPNLNTDFPLAESHTRLVINSQGLREDHEIGPPQPGTTRLL